jgi:hypothetical protein
VTITSGVCPNCRYQNTLSRRFCENCGQQLKAPMFPTLAELTPTARQPWWRRLLWFLDRSPERLARKAWRRSLPVGFRVRRYTGAALVLALIVGGLSLIGRNPGRWIVDRWNDLRGAQSVLAFDPENRGVNAIVQAVVEPSTAELANGPAAGAVDGISTTVWALAWTDAPPGTRPPTPGTVQDPCPSPVATAGPAGSLALTFGRSRRITGLTFFAGLGAADTARLQQHRPRIVLIGTATACQAVELKDNDKAQPVEVDLTGTTLWITVLSTYPPGPVNPTQLVAFTEVQVLARP